MIEDLLQYLLYGGIAVLGMVLRTIWNRIEHQKQQLDQLAILLAKNDQQNKELYNNITRLDKNIDVLFDKIDELLNETRCNNK